MLDYKLGPAPSSSFPSSSGLHNKSRGSNVEPCIKMPSHCLDMLSWFFFFLLFFAYKHARANTQAHARSHRHTPSESVGCEQLGHTTESRSRGICQCDGLFGFPATQRLPGFMSLGQNCVSAWLCVSRGGQKGHYVDLFWNEWWWCAFFFFLRPFFFLYLIKPFSGMHNCRCRTLPVFSGLQKWRVFLTKGCQTLAVVVFPPAVLPASDLYLGSRRVRRGQTLSNYVSALFKGSEVASSLMKYHPG